MKVSGVLRTPDAVLIEDSQSLIVHNIADVDVYWNPFCV